MGKNHDFNETIRRGFGRVPAEEQDERKQTGLKDVAEMKRAEVVEELPVAAERVAELSAALVGFEQDAAGEEE